MEYIGQYKCRRCGELFSAGATTGNVDNTHQAILSLAGIPASMNVEVMGPTLFYDHNGCADGGIGMGDFIGFSRSKDNE